MRQPLWRTVWGFLKKLGIKLSCDSKLPLVNIHCKKTTIEKGDTTKFSLTFASIPKECKLIDFVESESSLWKFYGIKLE